MHVWLAGLRPPPTALVPPPPRLDPGPRPSRKMKSFFWDKLPENRLQKTFWADHPPSYASLKVDEVWACVVASQALLLRPLHCFLALSQLSGSLLAMRFCYQVNNSGRSLCPSMRLIV